MSDPKTYLILGASGLLGQELVKILAYSNEFRVRTIAPQRSELDISDSVSLETALEDYRPDVVINAAAWTDVDGAEQNPEAVFRVNALAVGQLVNYALKFEKKLVQISTASVFSGMELETFDHNSLHNPVNIYNASKAEAERLCLEAIEKGADLSLVRTYWLYGGKKDFVSFVATHALEEKKISVVSDQFGQPTLSTDLAKQVLAVLNVGASNPIFHSVNFGPGISRLDLAFAIFDFFEKDRSLIRPVKAEIFGAPAPRPTACNLDLSLEGDFLMRPWREALHWYLGRIQSSNAA